MNDKIQYTGVYYNKKQKKYRATFTHKGETHESGFADTPREAAKLRDITIIKVGGPLKKLQVLTVKK
jgi:hypothetical protein